MLAFFVGWSLAFTSLPTRDPVVVGLKFLASTTSPVGRPGESYEGEDLATYALDERTAWQLTSHGVAQKLFTVDQHSNIVGQVAESARRVGEHAWVVTLKRAYKFSDGTAVDAQHVAACLTEVNRKSPSARTTLGLMTVTVAGALQVRIESTSATSVMDAALAEWPFVMYRVDENGGVVYTGPYAVALLIKNDHIDLVPNEYYPEAAKRSNLVLRRFTDGHALAMAVEERSVDVGFDVPVDTLDDLRSTDGVHVSSFNTDDHFMVFHNTLREFMADGLVRQAIDWAINRSALSQSQAGSVPTRSLFAYYTPYHFPDNYSQYGSLHGDTSGAGALLDRAGWALSNGKRTKDGQELTVDLVAYPYQPALVQMQPMLKQDLATLGITVNAIVTGDEWSETQAIIDSGDFDLMMWRQGTLPAGDPGWFLNSFFGSSGSDNLLCNLNSTEVDSRLDTLSHAETHEARVSATRDAHAAILAQMPVSNLMSPALHVGLSGRMSSYQPWGDSNYVIRDDFYMYEQ
mmetsp:Transcript_2788/g.6280  ORF Transcript_2788/g.6280 Transcript_2788/m.6280 type:complete len:517 (-) Transcript_2788:185-1735(-)